MFRFYHGDLEKKNNIQKWGLEKIFCAYIGNYTQKCKSTYTEKNKDKDKRETQRQRHIVDSLYL